MFYKTLDRQHPDAKAQVIILPCFFYSALKLSPRMNMKLNRL
jgi:hypothetical protein